MADLLQFQREYHRGPRGEYRPMERGTFIAAAVLGVILFVILAVG